MKFQYWYFGISQPVWRRMALVTGISMGKKRVNLVCQHMEGISAKALEKYQDIIREYIRSRHGVYALYRRNKLYYVGLARNLRNRLRTHLKDRHKGLWDRFSVYLTIEGHHIKELESLVLRIVRPKGNSMIGRFPKSQDLKRHIARDISRLQRDELLVIMGRREKLTKLPSSRSRKGIAGSARHRKLRATYKGKLYRATLRPNGTVYFNRGVYLSPSGAAKAILKRPINGWHFWKYERAPGDWVRLNTLNK